MIRTPAGANATGYNFGELRTGTISGYVYIDSNNCGTRDGNEDGVLEVLITLKNASGTVVATTTTSASGYYEFAGLMPGSYTLVETQPFGFYDGVETLGNLGGSKPTNDIMTLTLAAGNAATNYNFGELGVNLSSGMTATVGFWQCASGQCLIKGMPDGAIGNWLATNFPNLYGSLANATSVQIANYYLGLYNSGTGTKPDAQVFASALSVFVTSTATNATAAGQTLAKKYGFKVNAVGSAAGYVNVGSSGVAFDLADNTVSTLFELIQGLDKRSKNGVLLGTVTNATTRASQLAKVGTLFTSINAAGGITS